MASFLNIYESPHKNRYINRQQNLKPMDKIYDKTKWQGTPPTPKYKLRTNHQQLQD